MIYNNTMIKRYFVLFAAIPVILVLFGSCTDFFSTSLASWASRDPDKLVPAVTTDNVDELVASAENNPDLSLAVLKKIRSAAKGATGDNKQKLQDAALEAAVNASGLGQAVLGVATDLASLEDDPRAVVTDAIKGMNNLDDAALILSEIIDDDFDMDKADPNDLALAAVVLLAGEAKKAEQEPGGIDAYIDNFNPNDPTLSPEEKLAVDMALAAKDKISGPLADALRELGLI